MSRETMDPGDGCNRPGAWSNLDERSNMSESTCVVPDCEKRAGSTHGWCEMHRARMRRHGTLEASKVSHATAEVRFWRQVDKTGECWLWTGATVDGYGTFGVSRTPKVIMRAHRYSYELANGPIDDGLFVCHRCDNPPCVRPDHLFAGTHSQNMQDMSAKGRHMYSVACKNGHPWTEESTRLITVSGRPSRRCRICRRENDRADRIERMGKVA